MGRVPRSVLIVDDSAPFRMTARALLVARGYTIAGTAEDGAVNLPDMDGVAVARTMTSDGAAPAVVLISTVERAALGDSVEACGARGFLAKSELASPRLMDLLGPPDG
jgi:CheY-like chemotaxis protein